MNILGVKNRKEITDFAFNGQEAVDAINKVFQENNSIKYDLILMDCSMPFLDGYSATIKIREIYSKFGVKK